MNRSLWRRASLFYVANLFLSLSTGYIVYQWFHSESMEQLSADHTAMISSVNTAISQEMGDITNIIRLANEHLMEAIDNDNDDDSRAEIFLRIGSVLSNVSQIRWIDLTGKETIRVNFTENGGQIVPENELQDKSSRYYFIQAKETSPGGISLSSIDLNIENGRLTLPYQPTIRVSLHTFPRHPLGEGFLVFNFDMTELFQRLRNFEEPQSQLLIAAGETQWLINPDSSLEWSSSKNSEPASLKVAQPELYERLAEYHVLSLQRGANDAIFSAALLPIRMKHTFSSEELYILARTPGQYYTLLMKDALLPAILTFLGTFALVALFILRDIRHQEHVNVLNKQLLAEKTELKTALERQTQLRDELVESEKMASLGMLVAGVAHELSTPVGGTTMCISTLENKLERLEQQISSGLTRSELDNYLSATKESLTISRHNLERITDLIKRFKRLAVDRGSESPVRFNLMQVITDLIRTLESQASSRRVSITHNIPGDIQLNSFPGLFSQILQNLITNAIHHAFSDMPRGEVVVSAINKEDSIEIRVKDNGSGIAEEVQDHLFDPFVTTARNDGNTGLGMHLVHQWVSVLDGRIVFTTKQNEGTEFVMTFPVTSAPQHEVPDNQD